MSKFKLTQTAAEVQDILNNSLQKPTGLTKTKLVGVGVNGQENIEIGDNLTLANGKLSAVAGGVNGLKSDAEGNLTASKNLGVDGKLTLKSLVSASNPDGDITKELELYKHTIQASSSIYGKIYITLYNDSSDAIDSAEKFKTEINAIGEVSATGYISAHEKIYNVCAVYPNMGNNIEAFSY